MALAGDQTLKFKLVTVYIGEKDWKVVWPSDRLP